jgi:hypothetical protein
MGRAVPVTLIAGDHGHLVKHVNDSAIASQLERWRLAKDFPPAIENGIATDQRGRHGV